MPTQTNRQPIDVDSLTQAWLDQGPANWPVPVVVASTGSTNADLMAAAAAGFVPEGSIRVAGEQVTGRGRLDRTWVAPQWSGLLMSVLLRPRVSTSCWGWVSLMLALAAAETYAEHTGVPVRLKWPNDLVVQGPDREGGPGPRKLAGLLAEVAQGLALDGSTSPVLIVGMGTNLDLTVDEAPTAAATSLTLEGARDINREALIAHIWQRFAARYESWTAHGGDAVASGLAADFASRCVTIGQEVRVSAASGDFVGTAYGVDGDGHLTVQTAEGLRTVAVGDITHVRSTHGIPTEASGER